MNKPTDEKVKGSSKAGWKASRAKGLEKQKQTREPKEEIPILPEEPKNAPKNEPKNEEPAAMPAEPGNPADVESLDVSRKAARLRYVERRTIAKKLFDPQPMIELLRGRYRAVVREMRKSTDEGFRHVHVYEPESDPGDSDDPDVDFGSMMIAALEDHERDRTGVNKGGRSD